MIRKMDIHSHDRYITPIENHQEIYLALEFENLILGSLASGG